MTGLPLLSLSASIGKIVAILALLPPWILIYLVSGRARAARRLAAGHRRLAGLHRGASSRSTEWVGPYLPDVVGSLVCFVVLLGLLRVWRPISPCSASAAGSLSQPRRSPRSSARPNSPRPGRGRSRGRSGNPRRGLGGQPQRAGGPRARPVRHPDRGGRPCGPGRGRRCPAYIPVRAQGDRGRLARWHGRCQPGSSRRSIAGDRDSGVLAAHRDLPAAPRQPSSASSFRTTLHQMWGALLVGPFIFGLAYVFSYSGMANTMANGFAKVGTRLDGAARRRPRLDRRGPLGQQHLIQRPVRGVPAVGGQAPAGRTTAPMLPSLNSVGAEVGKPVAPQTASVGVSTTNYCAQRG